MRCDANVDRCIYIENSSNKHPITTNSLHDIQHICRLKFVADFVKSYVATIFFLNYTIRTQSIYLIRIIKKSILTSFILLPSVLETLVYTYCNG